MRLWKKSLLTAASIALVNTAAVAQVQTPTLDDVLNRTSTPQGPVRTSLGDTESTALRSAIAAARAGDRARFDSAFSLISDKDARRAATWALVDAAGERMSFFELDQARRDLAGFPRPTRRQQLAEIALETSGLDPKGIVDWFGADRPITGQGAMALASSLAAVGRTDEAQSFIRDFWRTKVFEADVQRTMLARFGQWLTTEDHIKRADMLLYGAQGPAARDVLALLPPAERAAGEARIAVRSGRGGSAEGYTSNPGLAFERMVQLRRGGNVREALAIAQYLGPAPGFDDGDARVFSERRQLFVEALKIQDYRGAYNAMRDAGFKGGERKAESDFFAGWIALTKLNDPVSAARFFEGVGQAGRTPLTQGRALYWQGRAAEAQGKAEDAQRYYKEGAQHIGAFYGQLAAEKAGIKTITLPAEPQPTAADRARFEGRSEIRAARALAESGQQDLFKVFVGYIDDNLPTAEEYALMMDMVRQYNEPFLAMMTGRAAAGKGFLMPERMYPVRAAPQVPGAPDTAFVLAITRQESSFDPKIRSAADARGMMMLLPSTASGVARRLGVGYSAGQLYEEEYNMRLGTFHLGELVNANSGSFLLTAVGYNAGPGRISQWIPFCGDPRTSTDPLDFIECAPFTETRNYMMRVMENVQVYRARLNGGSAPLTPSADLKRGGYQAPPGPLTQAPPGPLTQAD